VRSSYYSIDMVKGRHCRCGEIYLWEKIKLYQFLSNSGHKSPMITTGHMELYIKGERTLLVCLLHCATAHFDGIIGNVT